MINTFRTTKIIHAAMMTILPFTVATPAWAVDITEPAKLVTSGTPLSSVGDGGCAQQYTGEFQSLSQSYLTANDAGLGFNAIGAAATVIGLTAQNIASAADALSFASMSAGLTVTTGYGLPSPANLAGIPGSTAASIAAGALAGSSGAKAAAYATQYLGAFSAVGGVASQIAAQVYAQETHDLSVYVANNLPDCEAEFTGTVTVSDGGVNVTGDSIFHDNVGFAKNVAINGSLEVVQLHTEQGISAHGGNIWIGDTNGTTYSEGITIGGGAVSGAGTGGAPAITGHVDAIAIGNNAQAMESGSVALGLNANSSATDAIAIGNTAAANGVQDVVVGADNNTDVGGNNTVVGNEIDVIGAGSTDNTVLGVGHQVTGSGNFVGGDPITVVGSNNVAVGVDGNVTGDSNVAIGDTVNVTGDRAIAIGDNATASADDTTVVGTNAQASATGSAAYGQGAVATETQQQVFGTAGNTYTTPGITSSLSASRQTGPLNITTTDAAGNLATDGGQTFETLSENQAGIAIAMAMTNPSLQAHETFGLAINFGQFEGSNAIAASIQGVISKDALGGGERLSITGGFGHSLRTTTFSGRTTSGVSGGRVGFQLSW